MHLYRRACVPWIRLVVRSAGGWWSGWAGPSWGSGALADRLDHPFSPRRSKRHCNWCARGSRQRLGSLRCILVEPRPTGRAADLPIPGADFGAARRPDPDDRRSRKAAAASWRAGGAGQGRGAELDYGRSADAVDGRALGTTADWGWRVAAPLSGCWRRSGDRRPQPRASRLRRTGSRRRRPPSVRDARRPPTRRLPRR